MGFSASAALERLPDKAQTVVVGGGIIGSSIAYHLAQELGGGSGRVEPGQVLLLERDQLTSGTTWHAAGLMVTFGSTSETSTEFRKYTRELYSHVLEEETGQSTGFLPCGFIELASEPDRVTEFRRVAAFNRKCGVDVQEISAREVKELFPLCRTDDVLAGFYVKDDGRVNPVDATMAFAQAARQRGAQLAEGIQLERVLKHNGRVSGVVVSLASEAGQEAKQTRTIACEKLVNCSGMWARQLGEQAGVTIPNQAAEHYYLVTDSMPEVEKTWPVVEDPSSYTYIRPEADGLLVGLFEPHAAAWNVSAIPNHFSFGDISPDWDRMAPFLEKAMSRVPSTLEVGAKKFFCGPESFTPDLNPVLGEAPELRNYFVAAGMNSIGILTAGGVGRLMARWMATGKPDMDVTSMNIDRFHRYQANPEYRAHRVVESLGLVYKPHYPSHSHQTARGVKRSPFYERQKAAGAYFRNVSGWESPGWFDDSPPPADGSPKPAPKIEKLSWGKESFFPFWRQEHTACREQAALVDMSFMSKFLVQGRGGAAGRLLNRLSTAEVTNKETITYTQWLNDAGYLEADLTVTRLPEHSPGTEEDRYMVVATDTMHRHVEAWMQRAIEENLEEYGTVSVTDVTGGISQLNIQGPNSRKIMEELTSRDMSDEAFPFRACRDLDVGYGRVTASRITYVGELGYELYIPAEFALHVHDRVLEAGKRHGLRQCGLYSLGSLRMEKAYRDYGHDMDNTDTLLEVGLGFTCDFTKAGGFVGQAAVEAQKALGVKGLRRRLVQVLVTDPEPLMFHAEPLYRDGVCVGDIRAASYGHTLGGAVGLAMVEDPSGCPVSAKYLQGAGQWEVDIAGTRYPAQVSLRPMYDPTNARIKS